MTLPDYLQPESARQPHVIVVGGGVAGLVATRDLLKSGIRVTLLEASDRLGGKVTSHSVGDFTLDAGAESFATRGGTVAALATELGLGGDLVTPSSRGAWLMQASGKAVPLPKAGLLGIPSVPLAADVIAVIGLAGALRAQLDALMLGFVGAKSTDLATLVQKRMGSAVLDKLVAPITTAVHSKPPSELKLSVVAPKLAQAVLSEGSLAKAVLTLREAAPAGSAVQGIAGGVFRLVDALEKDIDGRADVRLDSSVSSATATSVTLTDGTRLDADHVIIAAEIGHQTGRPITIATIVVRSSALDSAPRGSGVIVASGAPGVAAKALTHATSKWEWLAREGSGEHVLRLSYEHAPTDDTELKQLARVDAELLAGVPIAEASVVAFDRRQWTGPGAPPGPLDPLVVAQDGVQDPGAPVPPAATALTETDNRTVKLEPASSPRDASGDQHPPPIALSGPTYVGERISGAGLAGVIASAREGAGRVRTHLVGGIGIRLTDL